MKSIFSTDDPDLKTDNYYAMWCSNFPTSYAYTPRDFPTLKLRTFPIVNDPLNTARTHVQVLDPMTFINDPNLP
jgi:hypothetical protein